MRGGDSSAVEGRSVAAETLIEEVMLAQAYFEDFEVRPAEIPVEEACYSWHVVWCWM